jgi:RimJ/RimL family protein N-acetyltransferase
MENLFEKQTELLKDILFTEVIEKETFTVLVSFLDNDIWNLIVPKTSSQSFDWEDVDKVIQAYPVKKFSYYLPADLELDFKNKLDQRGWKYSSTDTYISKTLTEKFDSNLEAGESFEEVSDSNHLEYISEAKVAFPEYEDSEKYTKTFYKFGKVQGSKQLRNFIIKNEDQIITFGSAIYSKELDLAYMHNAGTNQKFRRQGYFTKLKKLMLNYFHNEGIKNVYAIVEENGGSYHALKNLGFAVSANYFIYSK